jgi:hypothetical protein
MNVDLQIQVVLPELGLTETLSGQVPLEIEPFMQTARREPRVEELCQSLLGNLLMDGALFLERADIKGIILDDFEGWQSEMSVWRKRLIEFLYTEEFGSVHPTNAESEPATKPAIGPSALPPSFMTSGGFVMPEEAKPDDPYIANRTGRPGTEAAIRNDDLRDE